jgi:hypothetical protein
MAHQQSRLSYDKVFCTSLSSHKHSSYNCVLSSTPHIFPHLTSPSSSWSLMVIHCLHVWSSQVSPVRSMNNSHTVVFLIQPAFQCFPFISCQVPIRNMLLLLIHCYIAFAVNIALLNKPSNNKVRVLCDSWYAVWGCKLVGSQIFEMASLLYSVCEYCHLWYMLPL